MNFKKIFYKLNRQLNEDLRLGYAERLIKKVNELSSTPEKGDCEIDPKVQEMTNKLSEELENEIHADKVFKRERLDELVELVLKMIQESEDVAKFTGKRWKMIVNDKDKKAKPDTVDSIEPFYVF